tara:strand:+ start:196 stop:537 length:342 start_codon:yes stop_codon:yes gene_type:complete
MNKALLKSVLVAGLMAAPAISMAAGAGGGTEFDSIWNTLLDWTQGQLGKVIAVAMILVGLIGGIARQSLMAFAVGIAGGMGLYNAPDIIDAIFSATIPAAATAASAVTALPVL